MNKSVTQIWEDLGYASRFKLTPTLWVGGAIKQTRMLVVRIAREDSPLWTWGTMEKPDKPRPMGNLLTPHGLLPRPIQRQVRREGPTGIPDSLQDPMPENIGVWIHTPQGAR